MGEIRVFRLSVEAGRPSPQWVYPAPEQVVRLGGAPVAWVATPGVLIVRASLGDEESWRSCGLCVCSDCPGFQVLR